MAEKYIRKNNDFFNVVKNSRNYGRFQNIDDAKFIRDELVKVDWNPDLLDEVYFFDENYVAVRVIDDKIHILAKFKKKPSHETIEKLYKKKLRNPNNSKYGLNISKVFDTYVVKKRIAGDDYIFGYYDNISDAEFVRNFLLENSWDVNAFSQIQFDEDENNYNAVEVIDDRVYVLAISQNKNIDLNKCRSEFLNKITKHKLGLARHDYLGELTSKIPELEERFNIKASDHVWSFDDGKNSLDIVFSLSPFQQSVYDAVNNSSADEIEKSLIRFKSGNFSQKIQKNLNELEKKGLIKKDEGVYKKL